MRKQPGGTPGDDNPAKVLRPTVISPSRRDREPVQPPKPDSGGQAVKLGPTAIPGVQRKRLDVGTSELTRLSPLAGKNVIRRALDLLAGFVPDSATERTAILWGHGLQENYGRSVSRMLELSHDPAMTKAAGYVNRMSAILASIDLTGIAEPSAGVGQYLKRLNQRIDTPEELDFARLELDQLVGLMAACIDPLMSLKAQIEKQVAATDDLATEIEAMALAADYLANLPALPKPEIARTFADRCVSLTRTLVQIRETSALRTAQADQPLSLIAAVQDIALVTVPGWLSSLSAMTSMLRDHRRPTPTEAGELDHRLRDILRQLKA